MAVWCPARRFRFSTPIASTDSAPSRRTGRSSHSTPSSRKLITRSAPRPRPSRDPAHGRQGRSPTTRTSFAVGATCGLAQGGCVNTVCGIGGLLPDDLDLGSTGWLRHVCATVHHPRRSARWFVRSLRKPVRYGTAYCDWQSPPLGWRIWRAGSDQAAINAVTGRATAGATAGRSARRGRRVARARSSASAAALRSACRGAAGRRSRSASGCPPARRRSARRRAS